MRIETSVISQLVNRQEYAIAATDGEAPFSPDFDYSASLALVLELGYVVAYLIIQRSWSWAHATTILNAAIPNISSPAFSSCWILPVWALPSPNMASDVAVTVATTLAPLPVNNNNNNNNTAALAGEYISGDKREQTTASSVHGRFSKETAIDQGDKRENDKEPQPAATKKSVRFFAIVAALALSGLLTSLEAIITSTALPTITADLGGADLYIWIVDGFYLTQYVGRSALLPPGLLFLFQELKHRTAFQPLFGQIANIYGRR